jgi:stress-induced-phosphoprotein 1
VEAASEDPAAAPEILEERDAVPSDCQVTGEEWKKRGNEAVKRGDFEEAIDCYSAGLAAGDGDEAILCSNRAHCYSQLGSNEEGFEDASRCVALRPDFFKGYVRGAKALRALGRFEEALTFLKKCPPNDEAGALAAELRPEAAAAEAARIASLDGCERLKEEGNVLFRKGLFEAAAAKYSDALEACEDQNSSLTLAIRNNRAACFHQLSDYHAVLRDASYVLERDPSNFKALSRRMLALEPLERYEAALQDARAVLRQEPRNEVANRVQHRLSKLVRDLHRSSSTSQS